MTKTKLIEDLEFLLKKLPKVHNDLYALISRGKYLEAGNSIVNEIESKTFRQEYFAISLLPLFSSIGDSHTTVRIAGEWTPVSFMWIDGNYYSIIVPLENKKHLLKRLTKIDGLPVKEFEQMVENYIVYDNEEARKIEIARVLKNATLVKYLTRSKTKAVKYTFEGEVSFDTRPLPQGKHVDQTSIFSVKGNVFLRMKQNYYVKTVGKSLYVKYSKCREDQEYPLKKFIADIEGMLTVNPAKIIVDLRGNQGGNSSLFQPIISMLKKYIKKKSPKVYCLINRYVMSSGVLNTYDLKHKLGAVLVGQPTGQGINHFGEIRSFRLPNTKTEIQCSSKYFKLIDDNSNTITPDVLIEPTVEDYRVGTDVVLEHCLKSRE